jgi:hypothetical protein
MSVACGARGSLAVWQSRAARTPAAVNAPHLVALVRAGAVFKNGKLIERPDESEGGDQQVA